MELLTETLRDGRILTLRTPELTDANLLIAFHKRVGGETDFLTSDENGIAGLTGESEREYLKTTLEMDNTRMWLGFVCGELVSLCDVRAEQKPRIAHNAAVGIVVRKDHWQLSIGSILMREMTAFARATGVLKRLELTTRADNARAIALYERFGFTEYGCAHRAIRVNDAYCDVLQMELWL